jgi:aryl-alcohol dehydrogenase-like predicted oxidoreductase
LNKRFRFQEYSMQQIGLGSTGLRAPALGFGCAALLGRTGKRESLQALSTAWDEGIRFFDTARSYGYGESEALLGSFLKGRRQQAIIATKFGILPARQTTLKRVAKAGARALLAAVPRAHALLQKRAAGQFTAGQFTLPVLRQSLEESLRKLGTDYVDLLFLHAAPASVLEQEDLLDALARVVEAGKVRFVGLSAEPEVVAVALDRQIRPLSAMQFPCNVFDLSATENLALLNRSGALLAANHPFGGVARVRQCQTRLQALAAGNALSPEIREKLGVVDDAVLADVVLNVILRNTGIHLAIPAMMHASHIRANVQAISNSRFQSSEIATLRQALVSQLVS